MKMSLRVRLALSYLAVILVSMGIVAPLAWLAMERLYLNSQGTNLLAQAQLIAAALQGQVLSSAPAPAYSQTSNIQPGIHTRLLDPQGAVVIELAGGGPAASSAGLALPQLAQNAAGRVTPEELAARPEIAQARAGQATTAIRTVEAAGGRRVLYAAAPVKAEDGSVAQIVYLASPLPDTALGSVPLEVRWQILGVLVLAVLLAGAAGVLLSRRISHPLEQLAVAARGVSDGDLGRTVSEDGAIRELGQLGAAFNLMTASLKQADQAKTAFVSDVSHELRTPLTVIKGTIETLQDGALDDLAVRGPFLASMSRETERLIRLVNDLLVLTRADAGALNLQLRPLDLAELARSRCEGLERSAGLAQVSLRVVAPPGSEENLVMADADRAAQMLDNLLVNAIRYSPPGGEVSVTLSRAPGRIACQVADCGPGIAPKHLPMIFERFYRADAARGRDTGGSGLGLSIVRSLVQAHGGQVSVASQEGRGTAITFTLPAVKVPSN